MKRSDIPILTILHCLHEYWNEAGPHWSTLPYPIKVTMARIEQLASGPESLVGWGTSMNGAWVDKAGYRYLLEHDADYFREHCQRQAASWGVTA